MSGCIVVLLELASTGVVIASSTCCYFRGRLLTSSAGVRAGLLSGLGVLISRLWPGIKELGTGAELGCEGSKGGCFLATCFGVPRVLDESGRGLFSFGSSTIIGVLMSLASASFALASVSAELGVLLMIGLMPLVLSLLLRATPEPVVEDGV